LPRIRPKSGKITSPKTPTGDSKLFAHLSPSSSVISNASPEM
jgi:hypothetical protein